MPDVLTCPACGAQLRSSPEIPPGEDVRCPRCDHRFAPPPLEPPPAGESPREKAPGEYAPEPMPPAPPRSSAPAETGYGEEGSLPPARPPHTADDEEDDDLGPDEGDRRDQSQGLEGLSDQYTVDMGEWFSYAKAHWSAVLGPMIGYFLIVQVIYFAISQIPHVGWIAQLLLGPPLEAGYMIVALAQLQGRPWTFGDFFSGFQKFGSFFAYSLLAGLCLLPFIGVACVAILFAVLSEGGTAQGAQLIAVVVSLALLVPGIYVGVRVGTFGVPLIIDRGCTGTEALQGSWQLTRGHVLELFAVHLVLGLICIAGALALCVGLLFVYPFVPLTWAAGYLLIAGRRPPLKLDKPQEERPV